MWPLAAVMNGTPRWCADGLVWWPDLPLGQDLSRTAYRDDLRDVVETVSVFRNVRRAS